MPKHSQIPSPSVNSQPLGDSGAEERYVEWFAQDCVDWIMLSRMIGITCDHENGLLRRYSPDPSGQFISGQ